MMKKITFLLAAFVFAFAFANAQQLDTRSGKVQTKGQKADNPMTDVAFSDDFESYNYYESEGDIVVLEDGGWMTYDEDGDAFNWYVYPTESLTKVARSASWDGDAGALTPENWLVSPAIDLSTYSGTTVVLDWTAFGIDPDWANEHYKVVVSTTGNTVADFSDEDIVFEETLGDDVYDRRVDVSEYAGQEIYLAFVHYDITDMFALGIDNVAVGTADTYSVTFSVDMAEVGTDVFDPTSDALYVTGSMVGWAEPGTEGSLELTYDATSETYTTTITLLDGDYEYKYFVGSGWDGGEWQGGANRTFTVTNEDVMLNDVWGDEPVNVEEVAFKAEINVYPNPSTGLFNITTTESVKLEVFDISGRTVKSQIIDGNTQVQLRNAGMYFFRFSNENGSTVNKVIVK
jgi:hypothetical protein